MVFKKGNVKDFAWEKKSIKKNRTGAYERDSLHCSNEKSPGV